MASRAASDNPARTRGKLLVTSVGSGVGHRIVAAARRAAAAWPVVGANSVALSAGVFHRDSAWLVPPTADERAHRDRLLEIVEAERPLMVVPSRDEDLPALAAMREPFAELGAFALVGEADGIDVCLVKYRCAVVLRAEGLPFTATAVTREEVEALQTSRGFPLLAKPRRGSGSRGVRPLFDWDDVEAVLGASPEMVVQEYLVPKSWGLDRAELSRSDVARDGVLRQDDEVSVQVLLGHDSAFLGRDGQSG